MVSQSQSPLLSQVLSTLLWYSELRLKPKLLFMASALILTMVSPPSSPPPQQLCRRVLRMLLRRTLRIPFLRSLMRRIIFFGFNRLNLLFIVIILKATSLIRKFHRSMLQSKITMLIKSMVSLLFGTNKTNFFLRGCNPPSLATFFHESLDANHRGNFGIRFNHTFNP